VIFYNGAPIKGEITAKISREKIILDKRDFQPCHGKEVEEWSWKRMKNEKWIVHVDKGGIITKEKVSKSIA
jgi:phage pi2 protein 07